MSNYWQSDHIRLRAIEPEDAEVFYRWNQDSDRANMLDFVWPPSSLASVKAWADEASRRKLENDAFHWVIETLDGIPVGTISTHDCEPHEGTFSYGVDIAGEHRGHGYAGEAVLLVLGYYFEERRYQKVTVNIHSDNPASIRLHEKLGFQCEGCLRRMHFTGGAFVDALYYGMTSEEFHARRGAA